MSISYKDTFDLFDRYYRLGRSHDNFFVQYFNRHHTQKEIKIKIRKIKSKYTFQELQDQRARGEPEQEEISNYMNRAAKDRGFQDCRSHKSLLR